ncbi:Phage conserved hypothetical protein [uncultured Caudovirales phage]|uniref:Gp6 domain containing protein n=1 Tax=uncultured Caudovirales phage TaxID=2100421 RepID=A0A6J5KJG5_9CAUD|nr:Phage conserved hypothetical protein [uncultured Caudovirales phage]
MPSKLLTAPSSEPITLSDAKTHLRVDITEDDALISALIVSAREQAEQICRRALISQQWLVTLDRFPSPAMNVGSANWYGPQWGNSPGPLTILSPENKTGYEIYLPYSPLISVDSIKYIDEYGVQQTLSSSLYKVDSVSEPARILPAYGATWPATRNEINAIEVTLTTGWPNAAAVPQPIKSWMLLRLAAMYENRESDIVLQRGTVDSLPFVDSLLEPYRVITY